MSSKKVKPKPGATAPRSGAPTMSDVAKLAGVSPMTVSRVMNGDPNVRSTTRKKVDEAVAALNYVPNQAARRLAGVRPVRIGSSFEPLGWLPDRIPGRLAEPGVAE